MADDYGLEAPKGAGVIAALVFTGVCYFMWSYITGGEADPAAEARRAQHMMEYDAYMMSRRFIEPQLLTPATASYPRMSDQGVTISTAGDRWVVSAYVDAQNVFGATIRSHYRCEMTYLGDDQWRRGECGLLE